VAGGLAKAWLCVVRLMAATVAVAFGTLLGTAVGSELRGSFVNSQHSCYGDTNGKYYLNWSAQGQSFFDDFDFDTADFNNGVAAYQPRLNATADGLAQAHDKYAIIRTGKISENPDKRKSVKLVSKKNWKYFLAAVHFTHVPYGDGVWPAFWMNAVNASWPEGGELDLLEFANRFKSKVSMHTGKSNTCKLSKEDVNKCGTMSDDNGMGYNCDTNYTSGELGCAPNYDKGTRTGESWNEGPGVFAVEWTEELIRIFQIPHDEIPDDLLSDAPQPNTWDKWVVSYFPLAASERRNPGSCSDPGNVLQAQQLILNIGLCGDWAGGTWAPVPFSTPNWQHWSWQKLSGKCSSRKYSAPDDCCTQFVSDRGIDSYFDNAFFNISSVKVYQRHAEQQASIVV